MEVLLLIITVLCLAAGTAVLTAAVPFIWWRCFRLEWRLAQEVKELQKQIDTLDEALDHLLEQVGIKQGEEGQ